MIKNKFDVVIIGAGVAGVTATLRLAEKHKNIKTLLIDLGHAPSKRRRQCEGYLGCFPTSDGKLYSGDFDKVLDISNKRLANSASKYFYDTLSQVGDVKIIKDRLPLTEVQKNIKKAGFNLSTNDFIQWKPDSIHALSKLTANVFDQAKNTTLAFNDEVLNIVKDKKEFIIYTSETEYRAKKIILCVGRSGWRWANNLYKDLGILVDDTIARYGMRIELPAHYMKDFNKSHCTLTKNSLEIGPLSWNGTVIPEDHADVVLSSFRSNEDRWKSDKVSFSLIASRVFDNGVQQTERLAKLAYLLSNDRVGKERIKLFMKGLSQISLVPEYSFLLKTIEELVPIIPMIINKGYLHVPNVTPLASKLNLNENLETEISGLFLAGESCGIVGISAAGITGALAAEGVVK